MEDDGSTMESESLDSDPNTSVEVGTGTRLVEDNDDVKEGLGLRNGVEGITIEEDGVIVSGSGRIVPWQPYKATPSNETALLKSSYLQNCYAYIIHQKLTSGIQQYKLLSKN